jgi:hypothetical protein
MRHFTISSLSRQAKKRLEKGTRRMLSSFACLPHKLLIVAGLALILPG